MSGMPITLAMFGGRDPEGETILLAGILLIGLLLVLFLFGMAKYCYHFDKRERHRHGLPALSRMEGLRRTPFLTEAFGGLAILCGGLFPFIALAAHVHFDTSRFLIFIPVSLLITGGSLYYYRKFSQKSRR